MLVVFDIDGTLTRTSGMDAQAYGEAFLAVFGVPLPVGDWSQYRHATDSGILLEAFERRFGRAPDAAERHAFHDAFLSRLHRKLPAANAALQVTGAQRLITALGELGHTVALATGCYARSARLKLDRAELCVEGLPLATSDEECDRSRIISSAVALAGGRERHTRTVYVGDGAWDVAAARHLRLPFVGVDPVGTGLLTALGVTKVVRDFSALEAVLGCLETA